MHTDPEFTDCLRREEARKMPWFPVAANLDHDRPWRGSESGHGAACFVDEDDDVPAHPQATGIGIECSGSFFGMSAAPH